MDREESADPTVDPDTSEGANAESAGISSVGGEKVHKGCGGSVSFGAVALIAVITTAGITLIKKKNDE